MKRNFTLDIPTPCHENWKTFTPTQKGHFCGSCQKEVIDFTAWSEEQIKQYFMTRTTTTTCGRFAPNQLTTYKNYSSTHSKQQSRWTASFAFILLLTSRPAEAQIVKTRATQEQVDKKNKVTTNRIDSVTQLIIRGVVTGGDEAELLPGVNVVRKGTTQGVVTDTDGKFEMVIDQPKTIETLVTSFIGLTTVEQEVNADSTMKELKISMSYDITGGITLGGVVATGGK